MRHPSSLHDGGTDWKAVRIVLFSADEPFRFLVRQTFRKLGVVDLTVAPDPDGLAPSPGAGKAVVLVDPGPGDAAIQDAVSRLRAACPAVPILVAGSSSDRALVNWTRAAGVDGLFPKRISGHELSHRVTEVLRGARPVIHHPPSVQIPAPPAVSAPSAPAPSGPGDVATPARTGGRYEAAAPVTVQAAMRRDYALVEVQGPANRGDDRHRHWLEELERAGRKPRRGRDLAGLDVSAVVAAHGQWLATKGGDGARAVLGGKDLGGLDLSGAALANASFQQVDLSDANLVDVRLDGADLRRAVLESACLAGANLGVAQLRHANLRLADLRDTNLRGADLSGACLSGAKLADADFAGAQMMGADCRGTDLSQAANLTQGQMDKIVCDLDTRLPAGLSRPLKID